MAGYVQVSDEDRRWAANTHNEEVIYRGPCGQLFVCIDSTIDTLREQSPTKSLLLVLALFFVCALSNTILEDQHVTVLIRGGKKCALDKDLLDQENNRCRVEDKLALGYLTGQSWVTCAQDTSEDKLLTTMQDQEGHFWYPTTDKHKISYFYSTCEVRCASATDTYRIDVLACDHGVCDGGMCLVGEYNAVQWLEKKRQSSWHFMFTGSGDSRRTHPVTCSDTPRTRAAVNTIQAETAEVEKHIAVGTGVYYYDPVNAKLVRALYDTCDGPCACNDPYIPSLARCSITDEDVRIFFDPSAHAPKGLNAYCKQMGRDIRFIKGQGTLEGGWRRMTYDPVAKHDLVKLYKSCAKHVPCP